MRKNSFQPDFVHTRVPETERKYIKAAIGLKLRYETQLYSPYSKKENFGAWLLREKAPHLAPKTRRWYAAALTHASYKKLISIDDIYIEQLRNYSGVEPAVRDKKTIGRSAKSAPQEILDILLAALEAREGVYGRIAALMLELTELTGIRRSEWRYLQVDFGERVLSVKNGKATNERAEKGRRALTLRYWTETNLKKLQECLYLIGQLGENFEDDATWNRFIRNVEAAIRIENRRLFGDFKARITLKTMRDQYSCNSKAAHRTIAERGSAMGHRSNTSGKYYGHKRFGRARNCVTSPTLETLQRYLDRRPEHDCLDQPPKAVQEKRQSSPGGRDLSQGGPDIPNVE